MRILLLAFLLLCASACHAQTPSALDLSLFAAIQKEDIARIQSLLKRGADPNARSRGGDSALEYTLFYGDGDQAMRLLLQAGADPNVTTGYGNRILPSATRDANKLRLLIDAGADLKRDGEQAVIYAATYEQVESLAILLHRGVKADVPSELKGETLSALMLAVEAYEPDVTRLLLQYGARVNRQNGRGQTALMRAAAFSENRSRSIRLLLQAGANVHLRDATGETALMKAVGQKSANPVKLLLAAGANGADKNNAGETVLMKAVASGHTEIVAMILALKPSIEARNHLGETALMRAIESDDVEIVKLFLDAGADVTARDNAGEDVVSRLESRTVEPMVAILEKHAAISPQQRARLGQLRQNMLLLSASAKSDETRLRQLLQSGADPNAQRWDDGSTALMDVLGDADLTRLLLKSGANPNLSDDRNSPSTPLMRAQDNAQIMRLLLQAGARVDARNASGNTALMEFCHYRFTYLPALELLLENGADPNARNNQGDSALMIAASYELNQETRSARNRPSFEQLAKLLLAAGGNVNAANNKGETALMLAAYNQNLDNVRVLLKQGAGIEARDKIGQTALLHACRIMVEGATSSSGASTSYNWPSPEILRALLQSGADPNARDKEGQTALISLAKLDAGRGFNNHAPQEQRLRMSKNRVTLVANLAAVLIENGADVSLQTNNGNTAMKWAKVRGNKSLVALLEAAGAK